MMQFFRLLLQCGHEFDTVAVPEVDGKPYEPDYIGKPMRANCCDGDHTVKSVVKRWLQ